MIRSAFGKMLVCLLFTSSLMSDEVSENCPINGDRIYVESSDLSFENNGMWAKINGEWIPVEAIMRDGFGLCVICAPVTTGWSCGWCNWYNPPKTVANSGPEYCENCRSPKPANKSNWYCSNCGKTNNPTSSRCSKCSNLRPEKT